MALNVAFLQHYEEFCFGPAASDELSAQDRNSRPLPRIWHGPETPTWPVRCHPKVRKTHGKWRLVALLLASMLWSAKRRYRLPQSKKNLSPVKGRGRLLE